MGKFRWSPEPWQADLLAVVRDASNLFELPPQRLDLTLRLLRSSRLIGRVAWRLRAAGLIGAFPEVVRSQLESALVVVEARTCEIRWELDRIAVALDDLADVPVVALKGCAYLMAGTPNAEGRVFSDVDLLVPEADLGRVEKQLLFSGWQAAQVSAYDDRYYRAWSHEIPPMKHPEREVELDLHHNIVMRTARPTPSSALLLGSAMQVPNSRFKVLAPVDMVLHSMAHMFHGGDFAGALRELVDIVDLLQYFGDTDPDFWDWFWPRAQQLDLEHPAYYGLRFAEEMLSLAVPDHVRDVSRSGRPAWLASHLMAMTVPVALVPCHPDGRIGLLGQMARFALYVRSHWIKMPWLMLARHLSVKAYRRSFAGAVGRQ
jgi:hypothetical protein